ncbi:putative acetyltransferase [Rhodovulum iodosum]|uniref:Acetyltransferase n=1 Tax=Rhodovulum iodosum TaxID=68291 RepID=A0ABV3XVI4_9RHOB|nr:N-acetyltransferase [Rhodovulum robiginosum]RSK30669.1 N-acetyltransferase [Rhodovulum robiginosum]
MLVRTENPRDIPAITALVEDAFRAAPHSSGTEADIVTGLRNAGALSLSLVAEDRGTVIGHLAASGGRIGDTDGWHVIGPLAVLPERQGRRVGTALMRVALDRLRRSGRGAVLVGDPVFYGRFGFRAFPRLRMPGVPAEAVQALPFGADTPQGQLFHHPAFGLGPEHSL